MINLLTLSDSLQANAHGNFCQQYFYAQCAANIVLCLHPLPESEKKSPYTRLISRLLTAVKKEMFANADSLFEAMLQSADKLNTYYREQLIPLITSVFASDQNSFCCERVTLRDNLVQILAKDKL